MSSQPDESGASGPRQRQVEIAVAAFIALLGGVAIAGSLKVGTGWGAEGPQSGFFPFWIGVILVATSGVNLLRAWRSSGRGLFADWGQLRQVGKVVWPLTLYVAAVPLLGIYVSSVLLIAGFMRWIGRYGWPLTLAISLGVPVLAYVTFERWFLVPLPKGPLEDLLGL